MNSEKTGTNNRQQYIQRITVASSLNMKPGTLSTQKVRVESMMPNPTEGNHFWKEKKKKKKKKEEEEEEEEVTNKKITRNFPS